MRSGIRAVTGACVGAALIALGGVIFTGTTNGSRLAGNPPSAAAAFITRGQQVFRYETFGDTAFWGDLLKLHKAIEGASLGGVGAGVSPKTALTLGLKVDATKIPAKVAAAIKAGKVDLNSPKTTLTLLKLGAVVGVKGFFNKQG